MFRWRFTTDAQPRTKNGQPPHSTTGVASANCVQVIAAPTDVLQHDVLQRLPGQDVRDHEGEDRQR